LSRAGPFRSSLPICHTCLHCLAAATDVPVFISGGPIAQLSLRSDYNPARRTVERRSSIRRP